MKNDKWQMEIERPDSMQSIFYFLFAIFDFSRRGSQRLILDKLCIPAQAGSRLRLCSREGLSNAICAGARDGRCNGQERIA